MKTGVQKAPALKKVARLVIPLVLLVGLSGFVASSKNEVLAHHDKVTICHATGNTVNPFNRIVVDENAIGGHFENNGIPKSGHEQDILFQEEHSCPQYSVSIDRIELGCGVQEIVFTGEATYGENSDHLVVLLDGNLILHSDDEPGNWSTPATAVSAGNHILQVKIFDNDSGIHHRDMKAHAQWEFTIEDCETPIDVCPNLPDLQTEIPTGYHLEDGQCVLDEQPCDGDCETPIPTPGDVCTNIDGFQGSIPDGYYVNQDSTVCLQFQFGGPQPPSGGTGGQVLGTSAPQVLGASTLAGTGTFEAEIFSALFALGASLVGVGIRKKATIKSS